ncbi:ABC transporter substrate-binding protein [Paenibacillus thalictri]|uniref:ABC transporter substrate-binding protein n=1 Tax=Paenibacillus thalictri TaxID=2527873 RepID=UPI0013EF292B|nr:sugar ABC transporter substrate-binding protein [Paenibacillus thalictri]
MKKIGVKKGLSLLMTVLIAFAGLAGCSRSSGENASNAPKAATGSPAASEPAVTIKFWSYPKWNGITGKEPNGTLGDWEADAAKRFMALHPNVKIETEFLNAKGGPEKVAIAIQSNSVPDVLGDSDIRLFEYAQKGLTVPIGDYLDADYIADYHENVWKQTTIGDGKHYYLPWSVSPQILMVNRTLFKQAGADDLLPKNKERTWTIEEFESAIRTVSSKLKGVYGVGMFGDTTSGDAFLLNWIWSFGARTFDPTYSKIALNNEKGLAGMKFLQKLVTDGLANPGAAGIKQADALTLFNQQKVLTIQGATLQYARTASAMKLGELNKFELYVTTPPNAKGEQPTSFMTTYGYGVFKNTDANKQKWAIEFAKFLGSKENAAAVKASESLSTRKSMDNMYNDSDDENTKFAAQVTQYAVDGGLASPGFNKQRAIFSKQLQAMFTGAATPEQALKKFEEEANKAIAEEIAKLKK